MQLKGRTQILIALIGLLSAIFVALISNWDKIFKPQVVISREEIDKRDISERDARKWPLTYEETFTIPTSRWRTGSVPMPTQHIDRFDMHMVDGKYRWEMEISKNNRERWVISPVGPALNFYLAVDVKFLEFGNKTVTAGLLFGKALEKDYVFNISSNREFGVTHYDGKKNPYLIAWTPVSINPKEFNRISVLSNDSYIKMYINSERVGEFRHTPFTGGKIGLSFTIKSTGSAVVEFDNFEFRRKP